MGREKTAVIVFPPFNTPTSPPLGAAMLKGFVEREQPGWRARVFDLNLWTFVHLLDALWLGKFHLDPAAFPEGSSATADLLDAAAAFRGKNNGAFDDQPDLYNGYGELFLRFTETYTKALTESCEAHHAGGPRHPLTRIGRLRVACDTG